MNPAKLFKLKREQSKMQKMLEKIYASSESSGIKVVVRGDRKIESIEIDGQEDMELKDIINDAYKKLDKKLQKEMRGQLEDIDFSAFT